MRLLNTVTWQLRLFTSDHEIPPYAILSHTWGDDEVTLQQWEGLATVPKSLDGSKGYRKIREFGNEAAANGFDWVWVDT